MDVVLDSGGLSAWARHRPPAPLLHILVEAVRTGGSVVVPTVTLAESTTGRQHDDALLNRRLRGSEHDDCTAPRARAAAVLRHRAPKGPSAVDAIVAATAAARLLAVVVTSDPKDLTGLLAHADRSVAVLGI